MDNTVIGPFEVTFGDEGVEFRMDEGTDRVTLSYDECYELFRTLYMRRNKIYKRAHEEELAEPQVLEEQRVTYTVNGESLAVGSWEAEKEEEG